MGHKQVKIQALKTSIDKFGFESVADSIEEYAQHKSISFKTWCDNNAWRVDCATQRSHTIQEYYELFLKEDKA